MSMIDYCSFCLHLDLEINKVDLNCYIFITGGLLHVHDTAITTVNWLVKNVTYRDNCYMCVNNASKVKFYFFSSLPSQSGIFVSPTSCDAIMRNISGRILSLKKNVT